MRIFYTSCANQQDAKILAKKIIEAKLAACINILPESLSIYRWQDKICEENEVTLIIKTTEANNTALREFIAKHHPYELPAIIDFAADATEEYLEFLSD